MRSLVFYLIFTLAAFFSVALSKVFAEDTLRFIETTGRAIIQNDETIDSSRRRALEDALYLAALHGGAILATFKLDDFAKDSGQFVCDFLDNIGAHYIISQLNHCISPTSVGYGAWFLVIAILFGGGFFFIFDAD